MVNFKKVLKSEVFLHGQNVYSSEIKWAVVNDKMSGQLTNKD